jgi:protoporphyrinogen oxidase
MPHTKKIAIIGGGYTGLVAAHRLSREKGVTATILERGSSVGGLASDFEVEGCALERAYHHLFKTDVHIIGLAQELGIGDKLEWHDSSVSIYYDGRLYPFKGAGDLLKFKPLSLINRVRVGAVVLYLQKTNSWQKFQRVSAYDWMMKFAGRQATDVIWGPLLKGKFDKYYDKVSMAWLWARLHVRAQSREKGGEKLGYFKGGFRTFTDALVEQLNKNRASIRTGVEILGVKGIDGDKVKIEFADGQAEIFDACVATVPSHVFAKLTAGDKNITPKYLKKLESISYLGARLLIFSSTQDISPYYWHNVNDVELPFLVFINHTKFIGPENYGGKNIYYIATYVPHDHHLFTCDDQELEKTWFAGLKKIFPDFDPRQINQKHFFRFPNAQHIVDTDYASKIPSNKSPIPNLFLSNFSQIYPEDRGTNYAVREGNKVARLVVEKLELT